ncbi:MAG: lipopolysaccharide biosynthesis protein [Accumulibacter sp.]|jgi:teichuronic acid exporter
MTFRADVLSGLRWVAGAKLIGQVVTWGLTIVVMRMLSPEDYGLLAMATVLVAFLAMMAQFGVGAAAVQAADMDDARLRQIFGLVILFNSGLFLLLFLTAPLVGRFFDEPRLVAIIRVLGLQFVLMMFSVIPSSQLSRKLDFKGQSLVDLLSAIMGSLTALAGSLAGLGVWSLVWATLVMESSRGIGLNLMAPFRHWPDFRVRGTRQFLLFGGKLTGARILWFCYSQADTVIVGKLLGKDLLGVYSVAIHLASLPVHKLLAIINQVAFPAFARIQGDQGKLASHFLLAVRMLSFTAFPVLWGLSSVAQELVALLLGEKWRAATLPLQLLALMMPLHMLAPFLNTAAQGIGRADIALKQVLLAALVMPIAFAAGSQWGLIGVSLAWVLAFPVVLWWGLAIFLPVIGLRIRDVLNAIVRPALAALGMYIAVYLVRGLLDPAVHLMLQVAILVLTGALAYGVLALALNRAGCREAVGLMKG